MNRELFRTFVQPTAWRKNRDYVLYYHNWSWTVVTGACDDNDDEDEDDSVSQMCVVTGLSDLLTFNMKYVFKGGDDNFFIKMQEMLFALCLHT